MDPPRGPGPGVRWLNEVANKPSGGAGGRELPQLRRSKGPAGQEPDGRPVANRRGALFSSIGRRRKRGDSDSRSRRPSKSSSNAQLPDGHCTEDEFPTGTGLPKVF